MRSATASRQALKKPVTSQASARRSAPSILLQRKSAEGDAAGMDEECDGCKKGLSLQRFASGAGGPAVAPPIVHEVLRTPGQPLDARTRAFMEPRFGHDFSRVRVHADASAARSARAVNADAYTVGQAVVFAENQYAAGNFAGNQLLAHELAHVVQQENVSASTTGSLTVSEPNDPLESEADRIAASVLQAPANSGNLSTTTAHGQAPSRPALRRQMAAPPASGPDTGLSSAPTTDPDTILPAQPLLSLGSTDPAVLVAQHQLNLFNEQSIANGANGLPNAPLNEDSIYGPKTSAAVVAFQEQAFPSDPGEWDGIVGPHTWAALDSVPSGNFGIDTITDLIIIGQLSTGESDTSVNNLQPTDGSTTAGNANCPISEYFLIMQSGRAKADCQVDEGLVGPPTQVAGFRLLGLPTDSKGATVTEQFKNLEDSHGKFHLLQPKTYTTNSTGLFDDCYGIASDIYLPPNFRLKVEQEHLVDGVVVGKNQIMYTASRIFFCHYDRVRGTCDFGNRCKS